MKTQPTRSFAEYFWSLKTHHGFDPAICLDLGPGQDSAPLHAAFSKALHLSVLPGVELAAPSVPAGLRHEVLHEAALESTGSISDPTPPLKLDIAQSPFSWSKVPPNAQNVRSMAMVSPSQFSTPV